MNPADLKETLEMLVSSVPSSPYEPLDTPIDSSTSPPLGPPPGALAAGSRPRRAWPQASRAMGFKEENCQRSSEPTSSRGDVVRRSREIRLMGDYNAEEYYYVKFERKRKEQAKRAQKAKERKALLQGIAIFVREERDKILERLDELERDRVREGSGTGP
ncbi:Hypothetical predicted protein [Olea europaea subsp. europaea]|uniref:Uncharacterized protein n=1 Tax=Olea europaea subsp. europaea TaxID=158383 RepID=A0A8S0RC03_OLEEU|nr:Hypothetical predicted protein [Olea europaea subsp. europaea]